MAKPKSETAYIGTHISSETKSYFDRLKQEKGIPVAHMFLLGLFKAIQEIDPVTDPFTIPEIQRLKTHAQVWNAIENGDD